MAVIAQWLSKTWEVNPQKIVALEGLATSYKLRADTKDDAEGKPSVNVRGLELQPLSFDTFLSDSVGVDVLAEIESWGELVGEAGPFLLAGRRFGPEKIQLIEVSTSDMVVDDFGRIRQAKLLLSFREDAGEAAKTKPKNNGGGSGLSKSSGSGKAETKKTLTPGIANASSYSALGITGSAAGIGANTSDKAEKKPTNLQMGHPTM